MSRPASLPDNDDSASDAESQSLTQTQDGAPSSPSRRDRVRIFAARTQNRTKQFLSARPPKDEAETSPSKGEEDLFAEPAFNPASIDNSPGLGKASENGPMQSVKSVGQALRHPGRAMRKKATRSAAAKISSTSGPYYSAEQDRQLLDAHDSLAKATLSPSSVHAAASVSDSGDRDEARKRVERLEEYRASLKSAWALGRHVDRVRVVQRDMPMPRRADFYVQHDANGGDQFDWGRWLARLAVYYTYGFTSHYIDDLDEPPFDLQDLSRILKRLALVSGPWQSFLLDVRNIYMWEDPQRTCKWMVLFWTLWYFEHIIGFVYFYILYMTLRNRYYPSSVESIRESMKRGIDREARAQAWGELLDRHGRNDWLEPLLDEVGPMIQLQLEDLATFVEVLTNFYRWERPNKTMETLFVALVCLLITVLTDMRYCVKIIWCITGGAFFFTMPLATRYPKYRKVLNVFQWFFWNIPSHAELGIIQLQEKALLLEARSAETHSPDLSTDASSEYDTADTAPPPAPKQPKSEHTFRAYRGKTSGRLTVDHFGLRYRSKSHNVTVPFSQLWEMQKQELSSKSDRLFRPNTDGLRFTYGEVDCDVHQLDLNVRLNDRHEIFSLVLAWSARRWQPLPVQRHRQKDGTSNFDKSLKRMMA